MKRFWLLLFIFFGIGIFFYRQNVVDFFYNSPCDAPIAYRIGSIDTKFGLSNSQVLDDTKAAVNILSTAENKQLFVNSDTASLTINLVYDQRAALSNQINQLKTQLDQKGSTLQQQVNDYDAQVSQLEQKLADFNATVKKYNKEGGAPQDAYNSLIAQQKQLQIEANTLNQRARELNLSTNDYNVGVSNLNQDTTQFNKALTQKPEEGLYDSGNNTITIYFANNYNELIHTLTHEFGHALGMDHVSDSHAVMYPYTTGSLIPTSGDLTQLSYVCRKQPALIRWIITFDKWILSQVK